VVLLLPSAAHVQLVSYVYWVGRCFADAQNAEQAQQMWQSGMAMLRLDGTFDPCLHGAYARLVVRMERQTFYPSAVKTYLDLFEQSGAVGDSSARAVVPPFQSVL